MTKMSRLEKEVRKRAVAGEAQYGTAANWRHAGVSLVLAQCRSLPLLFLSFCSLRLECQSSGACPSQPSRGAKISTHTDEGEVDKEDHGLAGVRHSQGLINHHSKEGISRLGN